MGEEPVRLMLTKSRPAGSRWRAFDLAMGEENKSGIAVYHPCITEQIVGVGNALIFLVAARTR